MKHVRTTILLSVALGCLSTICRAQSDTLDLGFGVSRSRATLSESVSTISGERIESVPTSQLRQALEGQILGLGTVEISSEPGGAKVTNYVRGISTLNGTSPLFVVDGVVMQDYNIDYMTAEEIESISVLKDAAATAIYGLGGANGVVLITTKHARPGDFVVSATADFSMQMMGVKPLQLSAAQYSSMREQAWKNDGSAGALNLNPLGADNNWYKYFVRDFATMERAGVSLAGGTERVRAWANINFMNQTSVMRQDTESFRSVPSDTWVNFRAKADIDITDWVSAYVQISGNVQNNRRAWKDYGNNSIYSTIFSLPPTLDGPLNEDGNVTTLENIENPTYGILNTSGYTKVASAYLSTVAGLRFSLDAITPGLSAEGKVGYQSSNHRLNYSLRDYSRFYWSDSLGEYVQLGSNVNTNLTNSVSGAYQYAINYIASVDYSRSFGIHAVQAHLFNYFIEYQTDALQDDYPAAGMPYFSHNVGVALGYSWNDKVSVNSTLGFTGSDAFPKKSRYAFVPSVSAAWNIIPQLKLRASYGISALDDFKVGYLRYLYKDYIKRTGEITVVGNPDIRPELRHEVNVGLDGRFLDQISFSVDAYHRMVGNMLISSSGSMPVYGGILESAQKYVNEGAMTSSGVELSIGWDRTFGDWRVFASVEWAHNANKVTRAGEAPYPEGYAYSNRIEGYPVGQQFGLLTDGYISSESELSRYKEMYREIGVPRLGDFKYKDINDDGVINEKDKAPIGKGTVPSDFTSIRAGFGWKGFEVDLLFSGVNGWTGWVEYGTDVQANGIYNDLHLHAWTPERAAAGEAVKAPALGYTRYGTSALVNDWNMTDRSFWRLKNASVSYKYRFMKVTLSGSNLLTFSSLESKVIDPETGTMTKMQPFRVVNLGFKFDF